MKIIFMLLLCLALILVLSCEEGPPKPIEYKYGENAFVPSGHYTPINAVWIKKGANNEWVTYKCFNSVDELHEIGGHLGSPEKEEYHPWPEDINFVNYLVVSYVPPRQPIWLPFSIDDSAKEVLNINGRSKGLYDLFSEKEEREDFWAKPSFELPSENPVDVVWILKSKSKNEYSFENGRYKCFNSFVELQKIVKLLNEPELIDSNSSYSGNEVMLLYYLPPIEPLRLFFSMDYSSKELVTEKGRSKELYKLFSEKDYNKDMRDLIPKTIKPQPDGSVGTTIRQDINIVDQNGPEKKQ